MSDFPAFQRWVNPDGTPTLEALAWMRSGGGVQFVEVEDEDDIPDPPAPNTFYYERA